MTPSDLADYIAGLFPKEYFPNGVPDAGAVLPVWSEDQAGQVGAIVDGIRALDLGGMTPSEGQQLREIRNALEHALQRWATDRRNPLGTYPLKVVHVVRLHGLLRAVAARAPQSQKLEPKNNNSSFYRKKYYAPVTFDAPAIAQAFREAQDAYSAMPPTISISWSRPDETEETRTVDLDSLARFVLPPGADNVSVGATLWRTFDEAIGEVRLSIGESQTRLALRSQSSEPLTRTEDVFSTRLALSPRQEAPERSSLTSHPTRVFIVHGRDEGMKQAVARTIETLGLDAIILHEQPNKGRTIIEKLDAYSDVQFAVVLLSPDDLGYLNSGDPKPRPRARQNVVFELGFFIGKLGRHRVLPLLREGEDFEKPGDYDGVVYVSFDSADAWKLALVKELQAAGYEVDANALTRGSGRHQKRGRSSGGARQPS